MSIFILPKEVIQNMMGYLDRDSIHDCRQVCRLFYYAALPLYLKEIKLWGNHKLFLKSTYKDHYFGKPLGEYVKKIFLKIPKAHVLDVNSNVFKRALEHLPHLETIQFDDKIDYIYNTPLRYKEYLSELPDSLLPPIKHLVFPGKPLYGYISCKDYLYMCYRLRKQLLTASFGFYIMDDFLPEFTGFEFLSGFKSLEHLTLYGSSVDFDDIYLSSVLYCCPNLKSLILDECYNGRSEEDELVAEYKNLYHPKLETLRLSISDILPSRQRYIQHQLYNLKVLELEFPRSTQKVFNKNYSNLDYEESIEYWLTLDHFSLIKCTNLDYIDELFRFFPFNERLNQLYREGYVFSFSSNNKNWLNCEQLSIDTKNKRAKWFKKYNGLCSSFFYFSAWAKLADISPLSTIDIECLDSTTRFVLKPDYLSSIVRDNSALCYLRIITSYDTIYLGSSISIDWIFQEIDPDTLQEKAYGIEAPVNMLFLSHIDLSDEFFRVFNSISDQIQTVFISKCYMHNDMLDLRPLRNLDRLELDYSFFRIKSAYKCQIRFIPDGKEDIFSSFFITNHELVEYSESRDITSDCINVLYTQMNRLIIKHKDKVLYLSKDGDVFSTE